MEQSWAGLKELRTWHLSNRQSQEGGEAERRADAGQRRGRGWSQERGERLISGPLRHRPVSVSCGCTNIATHPVASSNPNLVSYSSRGPSQKWAPGHGPQALGLWSSWGLGGDPSLPSSSRSTWAPLTSCPSTFPASARAGPPASLSSSFLFFHPPLTRPRDCTGPTHMIQVPSLLLGQGPLPQQNG